MAFDGEAMWVASQLGGTFRIDAGGAFDRPGAITPIVLDAQVLRLAYDGEAHVWFTAYGANQVIAVNRVSRRVVRLDAEGPYPIAAGFGFMWVGNFNASTVTAFDIGTFQRRFTISLGANRGQPTALAFDGSYMWIGTTGGALLQVDGSGSIVNSQSLADSAIGALAFDGAILWVVTGGFGSLTGSVQRIDVLSGHPTTFGPTGFSGEELLCDGSTMWVYDASQATSGAFQSALVRRDCASGAQRDALALNEILNGWAFDGTHVWTATVASGASLQNARVRKILAV
jgi:hypothetical protein